MKEDQIKGYFAFTDNDLTANRMGMFLIFLLTALFIGYRAVT